jgi:hypothetical protein
VNDKRKEMVEKMEKDTHMQVNSNNKIAGGGGGV